jgi:nucleotide-binding universal stress UspA family protein
MTLQRIVVGVDGSEGSQRALTWSADLAGPDGAQVVAVHVVPQLWLVQLNAMQVKTKELMADLRSKLVGEWTEELRQRGVHYVTEFLHGTPDAEILAMARSRHADLVVIGGSHHHGLLGGTAHRIVNHATVPVLVVPDVIDGEEHLGPIPG